MIYEAHQLLQAHFATEWRKNYDGAPLPDDHPAEREGFLTRVDWPNGKLTPRNNEDWVRFVLTETSGYWGSFGATKTSNLTRSLGTIIAQVFTRKSIGPALSIRLGERVLTIFKRFDEPVAGKSIYVRTTQPGYINQLGDNTEGSGIWYQSNVIIPYQIDSFE